MFVCLFVWQCVILFTHELLVLLQNALAKATVKELATLHGTKYTYGPGATTICESWLQNCAETTCLKRRQMVPRAFPFRSFKACGFA